MNSNGRFALSQAENGILVVEREQGNDTLAYGVLDVEVVGGLGKGVES